MKEIGIIHVTDLHLGPPEYDKTIGAVRDEALSPRLRKQFVYSDSCHLFLDRIQDLLRGKKTDVLAFTGDLGLGKKPGSLKIGIQYLVDLGGRLGIPRKNIIVSPGNHDLKRSAKNGKEFDEFAAESKRARFTYVNGSIPKYIKINSIPIVALNSCLGGTEHALHGCPKSFWSEIKTVISKISDPAKIAKSKLNKTIKDQLVCLDISAVGNDQLRSVSDLIRDEKGNCIVLLTHHNPLPTRNVDVRPYATLIDSGLLVYRLLESKFRILALHGHTHCDSALIALSPEDKKDGFFACLGNNGLSGDQSASASHIKIVVADNGDFLYAIISRFVKQQSDFTCDRSFFIFDNSVRQPALKLDIDGLQKNTQMSFPEVAERLKQKLNDALAEDVIRLKALKKLDVTGLEGPKEQWTISRIA